MRFIAIVPHHFKNGAIGYSSGSPMDCLGPLAKVKHCPIHGADYRLTCYATSYSDTYFSVPAYTRRKGKYIKGYFTSDDDNDVIFHPMDSYKHLL